ncbi:MAG: VOC family protein [Actinomycetota bacterium]|nr:VOC family protein [Actinomycetota bacterium]
MLSYEDVGAAAEWLSRAFGFRERGPRYSEEDGTVTHAELELDGALVMLGWPGPDYRSPAHHAEVCEHARRWLDVPYIVDGVMIHVDDVDGHAERARSAGATILREPKDEPYGRLYNAADLEGHRWMFVQAPSA